AAALLFRARGRRVVAPGPDPERRRRPAPPPVGAAMALAPLAPETRNLIDGELVGASNGNTFENVSPSTEEVLGTTADGTKDDMLRAVAAARRAFDETSWSTD